MVCENVENRDVIVGMIRNSFGRKALVAIGIGDRSFVF